MSWGCGVVLGGVVGLNGGGGGIGGTEAAVGAHGE